MTTRIPVYQMTFGEDKKGNPGLVFTSEQDEQDAQSILFAIPIVNPYFHPFDFPESFEQQIIYFPFEMEGKYYELNAKINFPELVFPIPNTDITITFVIDTGDFSVWNFYRFLRREYRNVKYVGSHDKMIFQNNGFLFLMPIDLYEMDNLYLKYKGIFVGLTPNFGNADNIVNRG